jgi:hypothetical protein
MLRSRTRQYLPRYGAHTTMAGPSATKDPYGSGHTAATTVRSSTTGRPRPGTSPDELLSHYCGTLQGSPSLMGLTPSRTSIVSGPGRLVMCLLGQPGFLWPFLPFQGRPVGVATGSVQGKTTRPWRPSPRRRVNSITSLRIPQRHPTPLMVSDGQTVTGRRDRGCPRHESRCRSRAPPNARAKQAAALGFGTPTPLPTRILASSLSVSPATQLRAASLPRPGRRRQQLAPAGVEVSWWGFLAISAGDTVGLVTRTDQGPGGAAVRPGSRPRRPASLRILTALPGTVFSPTAVRIQLGSAATRTAFTASTSWASGGAGQVMVIVRGRAMTLRPGVPVVCHDVLP